MFYAHNHNNTMKKKDERRFLYKYIYLSLYSKGSKRVTQGLHVRGSWRPNIIEIFWPQSYGRQRCVFLVLQGCSTGGPGPILLGDDFLYCIYQQLLWSPNSIGVPQGPLGRVWFSLPHLVSNWLQLNWHSNSTDSSNSTELYNRSTPTRSLKSNV